jgi:hypothetical protein
VQAPFPHQIQINLNGDYSVSGFRHLPRQDGNGQTVPSGRIQDYDFWVSSNGTDWTEVSCGTLPNTSAETEVLVTPQTAHFVRLVAHSNYSPDGFATSIAELNIVTDKIPTASIDSPASDTTITVGDTLTFAGSVADPNNNVTFTYSWNFGSASGIADSNAQNPGSFQFNTSGTFTVTFTVTDSLGLTSSVTRMITVMPSGLTPISHKFWGLQSVDSEELNEILPCCPPTPATNAFDDDPSTFWHTEWINSMPPHPHDIRIDLGAVYNIVGFRHLPRQDGLPNGRIGAYKFYVSMNGTDWNQLSPVVTGTLPETFNETEVRFPATMGEFIWLRADSSIPAGDVTSLAELNVLTSP